MTNGQNTHTAERSGAWRSGAERPAAYDLIRGNKSTALFPRIKSRAAGRSAPPRSAVCVFLPLGRRSVSSGRLQKIT